MINPDKKKRQQLICQLIRDNHINNLHELLGLLMELGIKSSQPTLTRDLKELGIEKNFSSEFGNYYCLPIKNVPFSQRKARDILGTKGYKSFHQNSNFSVIQTEAEYTRAIAADIDELNSPLILGTIAGENTILVLHAENVNRLDIINVLSEVIPQISHSNKLI